MDRKYAILSQPVICRIRDGDWNCNFTQSQLISSNIRLICNSKQISSCYLESNVASYNRFFLYCIALKLFCSLSLFLKKTRDVYTLPQSINFILHQTAGIVFLTFWCIGSPFFPNSAFLEILETILVNLFVLFLDFLYVITLPKSNNLVRFELKTFFE